MPRPGAWTIHATIHAEADAAATWTNMPAADTFLFGSHRHVTLLDASGMTEVRLKVNKQAVAGFAGSKLILRYASAFSTNVASYADIGMSEVSVVIDSANVYLHSGWIELRPEVKDLEDIYLAIIGAGGNGVVDPQFGDIGVAFR